ncbi:MAG: acyl-CoA dehydrogenase family protein [Acidimicrobiales bacterium]
MAVIIQSSRQFACNGVQADGQGRGRRRGVDDQGLRLQGRRWVTREAMLQIHGGMGYAEEYDVSRYFVDARVLSIFEGADETLCTQGHRPPARGRRQA